MFNRIVCLLIAFVVFGCGEETSTDESVVVADPDMGHSSDQGLELDEGPVPTEDMRHPASDMGISDAAPEPDVAPPIEQVEATNMIEPVTPARWVRAFLPANSDPLGELYDRGEVHWPEQSNGMDALGVLWQPMGQDEDGTLGEFGVARGYALADIPLEPGERLMIRLDRGVQPLTTGVFSPQTCMGRQLFRP